VNKLAYGARSPSRVPILGFPIPSFRLTPLSRLTRGDVVVYTLASTGESSSRKYLVKRCVAIAGDTVMQSGSTVTVNGTPLHPPTSNEGSAPLQQVEPLPSLQRRLVIPRRGDIVPTTAGTIDEWARAIAAEGHRVTRGLSGEVLLDGERCLTYTFREDHFFAMGDNAAVSMDSREGGSIPVDRLVGKVILVYWSAEARGDGASSFPSFASIRWGRVGVLVR
jgi:signal peptidase I